MIRLATRGRGIVTVFAARHPERVRSMTLIAPVGLGKLSNERTEMLMRPLIGDWIIRLFGTKMFYAAAASEAKSIPNPGPLLAAVNRQLQYRGYGDALLSTMRNYPLENADRSTDGRRHLAVPRSGAKRMSRLIRSRKIDGACAAGPAPPYPHGPQYRRRRPELIGGLSCGSSANSGPTSPGAAETARPARPWDRAVVQAATLRAKSPPQAN